MTSFSRGEVVLVRFPNSDLATFKKRPALIVQADGLDTGLPQLIVALITSNTSRSGHPSHITVDPSTKTGMKTGLQTISVIVTDNLSTVRLSFIDRTIGKLHGTTQLDLALGATFGL